ncbi:N-formylglutamate amidohydrolase [Aliiroseovarius sp. YM-037]|uniref:N-formylglutamate amidohydrolase n=1 Tax=Aliiroseovarius sp. YM-037 TaxID=3341728 RepID=UPI003A809A66
MPKAHHIVSLPEKRTTSVVFASPHSGRDYSDSFLSQTVLCQQSIRTSEDAFVDLLFEDAPKHGAPFLKALAPRAYLDLNRNSDELDSALIEGAGRMMHNPRIASGLGVIPRVVASGRAIYRGKMPLTDAQARIRDIWHPYHRTLQHLMDESKRDFGEAILVDCHSMPHEAVDAISHRGLPRPDVVLGDRFGAAAHADIVAQIEDAFVSAGLNVVRNAPFAGAFITQNYGRPSRGQHAIQVEIDRSLYMNEKTIRPNGNFMALRKLIGQVTAEIAAIGRNQIPLAAE